MGDLCGLKGLVESEVASIPISSQSQLAVQFVYCFVVILECHDGMKTRGKWPSEVETGQLDACFVCWLLLLLMLQVSPTTR